MTVSLTDLKQFCRIDHNEDDSLLTALLAAAIDEAVQFCDRSELPTNASADLAVMMLGRAAYEADAEDAPRWREAALQKLWPFRLQVGA